MKKLKPVIHEGGKTILIMDADEGNADWIRSRRLLVSGKKKELNKKFLTALYIR